jgi:hypothetical protein
MPEPSGWRSASRRTLLACGCVASERERQQTLMNLEAAVADLSELKKLAEEAQSGPWEVLDGRRVSVTLPCLTEGCGYDSHAVAITHDSFRRLNAEANASYIAAASPEVLLRLIAVAEAAQDHVDSLMQYPETLVPINRERGTARALRSALQELEK